MALNGSPGFSFDSTQILRKPTEAWTPVEAMDNKTGRRFKKA
jgi:hypothetical protein